MNKRDFKKRHHHESKQYLCLVYSHYFHLCFIFYSANHAPYTYIDVIFWGPLCSFIGIVISIITRKTRKIHPALWISGIISCMLGYLDGITGEYTTPEGYFVDEQDAEEFDKHFS